MALLTLTGKRHSLLLALLTLLLIAASPLSAQAVLCIVTSSPQLLRPEGLAERSGDIVLNCSGNPGQTVTVNLTLNSSANITNRLLANNSIDLQVSEDGVPATGVIQLNSNNGVNINGLTLTIPSSGTTVLDISNLRVNASQLAGSAERITIGASNGALSLNQNTVTVGLTNQPSLFATIATLNATQAINVPGATDIGSFFGNQNPYFSTRITEGFPTAFTPRDATSSNGVRFIIQYGGYPAGARVFVPDAIAGSSATTPTTASDFGGPQTGGIYTPTPGGTLLLSRVNGADINGVGGTLAFPAPAGSAPVSLTTTNEVTLSNGAGYVVYEVVDANNSVQESAQIPTFIAIPPGTPNASPTASVTLAPLSNVNVASATDPIPRFVPSTPAPDCTLLGDCAAGYFPHLGVSAMSFQFNGNSNGPAPVQQYLNVINTGGGVLQFKVTTTYQSGAGFLTVDPPAGVNDTQLRLTANPANLAPGTYMATVTIDAGPAAGSKSIPVTFTVASPVPVITAITNAADFKPNAPLAPGEIATAFGSLLNGPSPMLYLSGFGATILYDSAGQINFHRAAGPGWYDLCAGNSHHQWAGKHAHHNSVSSGCSRDFQAGHLESGQLCEFVEQPGCDWNDRASLRNGSSASERCGHRDREDPRPRFPGADLRWARTWLPRPAADQRSDSDRPADYGFGDQDLHAANE